MLHNYEVVVDVDLLELGPIDPPRRGGSRHGKRPNIARGRIEGHERLMRDSFVEDLVYEVRMFHQRFRLSKRLFFRILESVQNYDSYFVQKSDANGQFGLSDLQKYTSAMCILAYGIASNATDEYVRLASSTSLLSLKNLCELLGLYMRAHILDNQLEMI